MSSAVSLCLLLLLSSFLQVDAGILQNIRCYIAYVTLRPDVVDRESYPRWLNEESVMTLAQAGDYVGIDDIAEYVGFALEESPFFATYEYVEDGSFQGYDAETGQCEFLALYTTRYTVDGEVVGVDTDFSLVNMVKLFIDPKLGVVTRANVYYPIGFLNFYFGLLASSDKVITFLCDLMQGPCANQTSSNEMCEDRLKALPVAETELSYVDGNTLGCRILHGAFASANPEGHCAHLSFDPFEDNRGRIKCQESQGLVPTDLFNPEDFDTFEKYAMDEGFDPEIGYMIND